MTAKYASRQRYKGDFFRTVPSGTASSRFSLRFSCLRVSLSRYEKLLPSRVKRRFVGMAVLISLAIVGSSTFARGANNKRKTDARDESLEKNPGMIGAKAFVGGGFDSNPLRLKSLDDVERGSSLHPSTNSIYLVNGETFLRPIETRTAAFDASLGLDFDGYFDFASAGSLAEARRVEDWKTMRPLHSNRQFARGGVEIALGRDRRTAWAVFFAEPAAERLIMDRSVVEQSFDLTAGLFTTRLPGHPSLAVYSEDHADKSAGEGFPYDPVTHDLWRQGVDHSNSVLGIDAGLKPIASAASVLDVHWHKGTRSFADGSMTPNNFRFMGFKLAYRTSLSVKNTLGIDLSTDSRYFSSVPDHRLDEYRVLGCMWDWWPYPFLGRTIRVDIESQYSTRDLRNFSRIVASMGVNLKV